jgi:hypothetical protein
MWRWFHGLDCSCLRPLVQATCLGSLPCEAKQEARDNSFCHPLTPHSLYQMVSVVQERWYWIKFPRTVVTKFRRQTGWLTTTEIYCLTVLEKRCQKSRCGQCSASWNLEGILPGIFLASDNPRHSLACGCISLVLWLPMVLCVSLPSHAYLLIKTSVSWVPVVHACNPSYWGYSGGRDQED